MFEIREVSKVEATGKLFWGGLFAAGGAVGTVWLYAVALPAALAC